MCEIWRQVSTNDRRKLITNAKNTTMTWTVVLEDENKKIITAIQDEFHVDIVGEKKKNLSFKLLKHLDPYGDTAFNCSQVADLIIDLEILKEQQEPKDIVLINEIIQLANECKNTPHTYIIFYGD